MLWSEGEGRERAQVVAAERMLRAGGRCRIQDGDSAVLVRSVDAGPNESLAQFVAEGGSIQVLMTGSRAQVLGLAVPASSAICLTLPPDTSLDVVRVLVGGEAAYSSTGIPAGTTFRHTTSAEHAAVELAKRAGLLPALLAAEGVEARGDISLTARAILAQGRDDVATLRIAVETNLPVSATDEARLVLFRSASGHTEHMALVIGDPTAVDAPLCRLHSECFTGDVFGSLRCDCGPQLNGALAQMADAGAGVLLYLRQEGRGIGLVNKLRAYRLQEQGLDTVDANIHLGFASDERDFAVAASMLRLLGLSRIKLLTNNPQKVDVLARQDVDIVERVPLLIAANQHNVGYLETKRLRSGHMLRLA